ncbi:MAG: autotransporter-associated beta strand repeat-containing protein [Pirellulales bacterium]
MKLATLAAISALMFALVSTPTVKAATFTWSGGDSANDWTVNANWLDGTAPNFATSTTKTDDLIFPNTVNTAILLGNNETEQSVRSMVFNADAPAYVFSNSLNTAANMELRGSATGAPSARLQNLSSNKQTFNTLSTATSYAMAITSATTVDAGTAGFDFGGDVYFGGTTFLTGSLGGDITIHGSFQGVGTRVVQKIGVNTLFLTGSPTAAPSSTLKDARMLIGRGNTDTTGDAGIVRIDNNNSLQNPGSDTSGYTIIYGRNPGAAEGTINGWNGRLELTNNITTGEFISIGGRDGTNAQAPSLWNFSGDNTLTGTLEVFGIGPNLNFGSASGKLTFNNSLFQANNGTSNEWDIDHVFNWTGGGDGEFVPGLPNFFATADLSLNVAGSGAGSLKLSGDNTYSGNTTVTSGKLTLSPASGGNNSIPNSPVIDVDTSGTLDVASFDGAGGFIVGNAGAQTLKGNGSILGDVHIATGSELEVDYGSFGIDKLTFSGVLDIADAAVDFNQISGNLSAGTHVFAQYDSLSGAAFASTSNLPAGFSILYNFGANSNQLALMGAPIGLSGDFNGDNVVDAADYVVWRKGVVVPSTPENYNLWREHFGDTPDGASVSLGGVQVPEPATCCLLFVTLAALSCGRIRPARLS